LAWSLTACYQSPTVSNLSAISSSGTVTATVTVTSVAGPTGTATSMVVATSAPDRTPTGTATPWPSPTTRPVSTAHVLSYISEGDIWQVDLSTPAPKPVRLTMSGRIVRYGWSPNGRALWYEELLGKLRVQNLPAGRAYTMPGAINTYANWSPDSSTIVYVSYIVDDGWPESRPTYTTELRLFDLKERHHGRLLDGTEADRLLFTPQRLSRWPKPAWEYARPLFVNERVVLLDILSQGSTVSDKETYLNVPALLELTDPPHLVVLSQHDPLNEEDMFDTSGAPLIWQLAPDGKNVSIIQPFTQVYKLPGSPPSGAALAWWIYDMSALVRHSILPLPLVCDEIDIHTPAAWGLATGMAWQNQSPVLTISFLQTQVSPGRSTGCPVSDAHAIYGLVQEGNTWSVKWVLPGGMEPAWSSDDRLLAYTTVAREEGVDPWEQVPPGIKIGLNGPPQLDVQKARWIAEDSISGTRVAQELLNSKRFHVRVVDSELSEVFHVSNAHSPAWQP